MTMRGAAQADGVELGSCDREPIHAPGAIQPHGVLMVLEGPRHVVRRVSGNSKVLLGLAPDEVLGRTLAEVLGAEAAGRFRRGLDGPALDRGAVPLGVVRAGAAGAEAAFYAIAYRCGAGVVLELEPDTSTVAEPFHDIYPALQAFLARLAAVEGVDDLARLAAGEVRRITGFDRVLVYRFDDDGHGTVVAEDRNDRLPAYLGHRFPASDIPSQARALYRLNRLRLIPDAGYTPVPIVPADAPPLDLSGSTLRSVSPVHVEYMRNMGTAASMSVSVLQNGRLWGLIACHHAAPRLVPFAARASCDFLAQVFAVQLANKGHHEEFQLRIRLGSVQAGLVASLTASDDPAAGLADHAGELLSFAGAGGVAILLGGECTLLGETPGEDEVRRIADWLSAEVRQDVFATDALALRLPWAEAVKGPASGLLAVTISTLHRSHLMWFRPEVVRTVTWAGDPDKPAEPDPEPGGGGGGGAARGLRPRLSFEAWRETVRLRSAPWRRAEVDAASSLRNAFVNVVLRKAEEMAQLTAELERSNHELEAFSYSVSHDLRAPFRHIVGFAELLRDLKGVALTAAGRRYVDTIIESATFAGSLVDNLLAFSRLGRTRIQPIAVDMNLLVREAIVEASRDAAGRSVVWKVGDLLPATGDPMMLRMAVTNLLSNAVKYTRPRAEAVVELGAEVRGGENVYSVRDNGIGFDMRYADKLFGVFQRLHRMEDFEGTGIGLANVRRVMARHGGRAWGEGAVDAGATFFFSLPGAAPPGRDEHAETDSAGGR